MFRKIRKGFTLAEVLITLAIIGVIASLTTPAIMRNSQNAKIGPQLAKIVTTIENAAQMAVVDQDRTYFKDVIDYDSSSVDLVVQMQLLADNYMKAKKFTFGSNESMPSVVGMDYSSYSDFPDTYTIFMFSDKSAIVVSSCTVSLSDSCEIFALMPGFATRSRLILGRDIFPLFVTGNGDVVTPEEAGMTTTTDCTDSAITAGNITGYTCVNRIAKNGWKADW